VGCYTLQPSLGATPELGTVVAFDVNDAGRFALGGQMGPEIGQVEGRLVSRDSGEYLVAVSSVHFIRGGDQVWTGEKVLIKSEYITGSYQRKFDAPRSVVFAAIGVGAAAYFVTRSLFGFGVEDPVTSPHDTVATHRGPRR